MGWIKHEQIETKLLGRGRNIRKKILRVKRVICRGDGLQNIKESKTVQGQ